MKYLHEWCCQCLVTATLKDVTKENVHGAELSPFMEKLCWNLKLTFFTLYTFCFTYLFLEIMFEKCFFFFFFQVENKNDLTQYTEEILNCGYHLGAQRQYIEVFVISEANNCTLNHLLLSLAVLGCAHPMTLCDVSSEWLVIGDADKVK